MAGLDGLAGLASIGGLTWLGLAGLADGFDVFVSLFFDSTIFVRRARVIEISFPIIIIILCELIASTRLLLIFQVFYYLERQALSPGIGVEVTNESDSMLVSLLQLYYSFPR